MLGPLAVTTPDIQGFNQRANCGCLAQTEVLHKNGALQPIINVLLVRN